MKLFAKGLLALGLMFAALGLTAPAARAAPAVPAAPLVDLSQVRADGLLQEVRWRRCHYRRIWTRYGWRWYVYPRGCRRVRQHYYGPRIFIYPRLYLRGHRFGHHRFRSHRFRGHRFRGYRFHRRGGKRRH